MSKVSVLVVDDATFIRDLVKRVCATTSPAFRSRKP